MKNIPECGKGAGFSDEIETRLSHFCIDVVRARGSQMRLKHGYLSAILITVVAW